MPNTGMWSGHGVVAALGLLRRTPPEQLAHAFAIAGMSAPNQLHAGAGPAFRAQEGSDVKEGIPWSSVTAVNALLLAEAGHGGPLGLLDNDEHFRLEGNWSKASAGSAMSPATTSKFHACCRHVHAPGEALLGLLAQHRIDPDDIEAIEVATYSGALRLADRPRPQGFTDIQFSIPYCLALVAIDGADALLPLTRELSDRSRRRRARREGLPPPRSRTRRPLSGRNVVALCHDPSEGRSFTSPVTAPRGEASAPPLSWADLEEKLRRATRLVARRSSSRPVARRASPLASGDHAPLLEALRR